VNDGSTDEETVSLLQHLERQGTRVIHTANSGVSAARNRGITESRGKYILPLDADDLIGPEYLEKTATVLDEKNDVAVVYGERKMFGEKEGIVQLPEYDPRMLLLDNCIYPAALFRKDDWRKVGGYNERMINGWEDWDFWIALSGLGKRVVKLPDVLFYYRVRSCSRDHSLTFAQKLKMFSLIVVRNRALYLQHLPYVISRVCVNKIPAALFRS
jgi:glycosyltransferase involved in cell wall biosynthesis